MEDFYVVPDPLPPGEPGDLIRVQPIEASAGEAGLRIMYHSTDAEGDDRAVTGVVYHPTGTPPDDGWPVLAWAHGTSGIAPQCAPSRVPAAPPAFGVDGVRVATDYIGLGPVGEVHPYLSAAAEGNAVIDSVRAAGQIPDAHAGTRWLVAGHSQGGHAALMTGEAAAERLPDHELLGTVAIAPGAELGKTYGDEVQVRIITTMVLFGLAAEDPEIDPADYLTPAAYEAARTVVAEACVDSIINTMVVHAVCARLLHPGPARHRPRRPVDGGQRPWRDGVARTDPADLRRPRHDRPPGPHPRPVRPALRRGAGGAARRPARRRPLDRAGARRPADRGVDRRPVRRRTRRPTAREPVAPDLTRPSDGRPPG